MSGLGAQARAAEYAAATAARARQVSREAEDQKLPPKAAPVSLSALAKAQPTSRNKGPKAWKPLNLDEITESSDDGSTGKESGRGSPAPSSQLMLEWASPFVDRQVSATSTRVEGIRVNIPTAPRAMMTSHVPIPVNANHSPQWQTEPVEKLPISHSTRDAYMSPGPFAHGGYAGLAMPSQLYSRHPCLLGTPTHQEATQFQRFGSMMVPSDLSPTKQQQKFAMLGQMQDPTYVNDPAKGREDVLLRPILSQRSPSYYEYLNTLNAATTGDTYCWDVSFQDPTCVDYTFAEHTFQDHIDVDYGGNGEEVEGFHIGTPAPGHPMIHQQREVAPVSYTLKEGPALALPSTPAITTPGITHQYRRSSLMSSSETKRQHHPAALEQEEPYDRRTKMQRFVAEATHEALTRKGKTVLHNPDLYKEKDQSQPNAKCAGYDTDQISVSNNADNRLCEDESREKKSSRPVPWDVRPVLSHGASEDTQPAAAQGQGAEVNHPSDVRKESLEVIANDVSDQINELDLPRLTSATSVLNKTVENKFLDKNLDPIGQVGSEEWAKFRPVTAIERERVQACMAKAAVDLAPKITRPRLFDYNDGSCGREDDLKQSKEWFYRDLRGEQAFRAQLPAIAEKHATIRQAAARHANGGSLPSDFKLGIDDGVAANIIMGEVIANLTSYVIGDRKSAEQRRNFHKVKSVPEFATERAGSSGASGPSDSYFDDDDAGFQGAPVRIARDPRFRPQGKEGVKLKPEEEWKNRHEMYGRRVL
jgi:hypothetical protein